MELFIDPTDGRSIATQVYAQLRDAITDGRLVTGDRLTPSRMLAGALGVSRFTVTDAYARLSAEGLIEGRAGGGSVVCATSTRARRCPSPPAPSPTPRAAQVEMFSSIPPPTLASTYGQAGSTPACSPPTPGVAACCGPCGTPAYGDPAGTIELRTALARWVLHPAASAPIPPTSS